MEETLRNKEENRINRASLRSRRLIITALLELMEDHPFIEITIREIADKADLVRRTFYGHFSSKDDVLRSHIDGLCTQLSKKISETGRPLLRNVSGQFFSFWSEHADFLRMLKKNGLFIPIDAVERFLKNIDFTLHIKQWKHLPEREYPFACAYMAGGLMNLLNSWVDRDCVETSEDMAETFISLIGIDGGSTYDRT